jgi:hypothetical protein
MVHNIEKNEYYLTTLNRTIRPTEGVPGAIRQLTLKDIRDSSIRLKWHSPESFNGQFVKYVVTYQVLIKKVGIIN